MATIPSMAAAKHDISRGTHIDVPGSDLVGKVIYLYNKTFTATLTDPKSGHTTRGTFCYGASSYSLTTNYSLTAKQKTVKEISAMYLRVDIEEVEDCLPF